MVKKTLIFMLGLMIILIIALPNIANAEGIYDGGFLSVSPSPEEKAA